MFLQMGYSVADPSLNNRQKHPTFFRTFPNDGFRFSATIKLILQFGWTFVGMISTSDGSGDTELKELSKGLTKHGICIEYIIQFPKTYESLDRVIRVIKESSSTVVIICGMLSPYSFIFFKYFNRIHKNITLLLHESWLYIETKDENYHQSINCSFSFKLPLLAVPGLKTFIDGLNPSNNPNDPYIEDINIFYYRCLSNNNKKNMLFSNFYNITLVNCTRKWRFIFETFTQHYYIYTAVYTLAHALHMMTLNKDRPIRLNNRVNVITSLLFCHYGVGVLSLIICG